MNQYLHMNIYCGDYNRVIDIMIYLFGDSFVYRDDVTTLGIRDYKRWQDILSEQCNEEIDNFGQNGESCYETMNKFSEIFEKKYFDHDDKFVIVLSSAYRIPWRWDHESAYWYGKWLNKDLSDERQLIIDSFYDCMADECSRINIKNVLFLKELSKINGLKMCVFTSFRNKEFDNEKDVKYEAYNLDKINDKNFYFHSTPLYEHSKAEGKYSNISKGLINHLSERNHVILANLITNHFCNTKLNSRFHEKFILNKINDEFQYTEVTDNNYCEFIYE